GGIRCFRVTGVQTCALPISFMAICEKWDVPATVSGGVPDTGRLVMTWHGATIVDIPPGTAAHEGPVYERPYHEPAGQAALNADRSEERRVGKGGRTPDRQAP